MFPARGNGVGFELFVASGAPDCVQWRTLAHGSSAQTSFPAGRPAVGGQHPFNSTSKPPPPPQGGW